MDAPTREFFIVQNFFSPLWPLYKKKSKIQKKNSPTKKSKFSKKVPRGKILSKNPCDTGGESKSEDFRSRERFFEIFDFFDFFPKYHNFYGILSLHFWHFDPSNCQKVEKKAPFFFKKKKDGPVSDSKNYRQELSSVDFERRCRRIGYSEKKSERIIGRLWYIEKTTPICAQPLPEPFLIVNRGVRDRICPKRCRKIRWRAWRKHFSWSFLRCIATAESWMLKKTIITFRSVFGMKPWSGSFWVDFGRVFGPDFSLFFATIFALARPSRRETARSGAPRSVFWSAAGRIFPNSTTAYRF